MVDPALAELERKLSSLSHSDEAIQEVERFCASLNGTRARLAVWNRTNAIVRRPIEPETSAALGFNTNDDAFLVLQGDIVRTESAYFFGDRLIGNPKYAVLNSSCDLVPGRTTFSSLLRMSEISREDPNVNAIVGQLLKFTRRDSMYIPPLPDDPNNVVANVIRFDGIAQIRTDDLQLGDRIASLSLVGWRIFASFVRTVVARANPREALIRSVIERADEDRPITSST